MIFQILKLTRIAFIIPIVVTFQSLEQLEQAFFPHSMHEVKERIASTPFTFQYRFDKLENQTTPLRNPGIGNLLKHELFCSDQLTVYYPETPRVPHHLTIALNRLDINGMSDVTEEENQALFTTIEKISEIYKQVNITGFVIAQYDKAQQSHLNHYIVEIIPHLPGFNHIKNMVDKIDCNRYVLFRSANLTPVIYEIAKKNIENYVHFWEQAFKQTTSMLDSKDLTISFPYFRYRSHWTQAQKILEQHLLEILQDNGAQTTHTFLPTPILMPTDIPEKPQAIEVTKCPFCDPMIIQKQRVFEYGDVELLYNRKKGAKPGCMFLLLPKKHKEKIYSLSSQEIHDIHIMRRALIEVLQESHPGHEIVSYIQDAPCVGQTVFHSHEQVLSFDPDTMALSWTLLSFCPNHSVSDEEILQITKEFGQKMEKKIKELTNLEEAM